MSHHRQLLQRTHQEERGDKEQKTTILHRGCRVLTTHHHGPQNYTTRLLMANSRVQQESKMQQQHYGINTHPAMTTIEQFRYRLQSQVTLSEGKEKSSETEYQYRKRQAVTSNSTNEESSQTIDEDEAAVTAMSIHRSLKFAMPQGKKDLLEKIKEEEDLVQLLQEHGPLKTKTIEDLRLTLMTVPVYHHLNM